MVRVEEIRKAITELPIKELRVYLDETIWEGIEEGGPEEEEIDRIRDEAMEPFLTGYDNEETRSGYNKLTHIMQVSERRKSCANSGNVTGRVVQAEEIKKAITELPVDELRVYLEETIWEGIEEGSPEEWEVNQNYENATAVFVLGHSKPETKEGYGKLWDAFIAQGRMI